MSAKKPAVCTEVDCIWFGLTAAGGAGPNLLVSSNSKGGTGLHAACSGGMCCTAASAALITG